MHACIFTSTFSVSKVNGDSILFWNYLWCGEERLKFRFPNLYLLSSDKEVKIVKMRAWSNNIWKWDLKWNSTL